MTRPPDGGALLSPLPASDGEPGLLAARARDLAWSVTARERPGEGRVRLLVRVDAGRRCAVEADHRHVNVQIRVGP